jgi:hypothetical protein
METVEADTFRTLILVYFIFTAQCLSANIKLTIHKLPIRSVMT